MTFQQQIRESAEAIRGRIRELQHEIDVEWAKLRVVRTNCKHPAKYETSTMGDSGWRCPDCGESR